jgi:hypothetical protein
MISAAAERTDGERGMVQKCFAMRLLEYEIFPHREVEEESEFLGTDEMEVFHVQEFSFCK